ncbi:MAG TPA: tryptophan-rich sensory protein [Candidatus Rifleibacterium sp.]|nr:tryptophan-rich sensory protein [Candidatus Rifleibacterium sp.]HPW57135.1 tryptophan-rich sensory protein [Candidatus Rifleibacterium sp.]
MESSSYSWYMQLRKPDWAPPGWVFGPVWSFLYLIIAISFGYVFYLAFKKKIPRRVTVPFILNLVFNFAFTPLQFGLRSNILAAIDVVLVLLTLIWSLVRIRPLLPWVALVNLPYLLWVSFATVLQLTITWMNLK